MNIKYMVTSGNGREFEFNELSEARQKAIEVSGTQIYAQLFTNALDGMYPICLYYRGVGYDLNFEMLEKTS